MYNIDYDNLTYKNFIDNIINTRGQWNIPDGEYYEMHHIIPRCMGGEPKNRKDKYHDNIIWLYPFEHYIAHILLIKEYPDNDSLWFAFWYMSGKYRYDVDDYERIRPIVIEKIRQVNLGKKRSKETRDKISSYFSKNPNKSSLNKKWINDGFNELYIDKDSKLPEGYNLGRLPLSNKTKNLLRESTLSKRWYNNGKENLYLSLDEKIPEGFIKGRIKVGSWYNNGENEILVKDVSNIPEGFIKGRLPVSRDTRKKMSLSRRGVKKSEAHKEKLKIATKYSWEQRRQEEKEAAV